MDSGCTPRARLAVLALLALGTTAAFLPLLQNDFISCDDAAYVTANPHVRAGLTWDGFRWAWSTLHSGNWHPLTWLSHMLDVQVFGMRPWGHHLSSLLLHVASTLLLFRVLERMTAACGRSALVAALFAVHPLHVESVAWVAERKDVLGGLFFVLTLWAYARSVRAPGWRSQFVVWLALTLGLLCKPMLVTTPFVLLLLDRWPLGRWAAQGFRRLVLEKVWLLLPVAASCAVTLAAQARAAAVSSLEEFSLGARVGNAIHAYGAYLLATVLPLRLSFFYPHPVAPRIPEVAFSLLALAALTALALQQRAPRPYLLCGWLFYLGTLVPVSGLVQVGVQARADRYTYIPLIGIFVMLSWGAAELLGPVTRRAPRLVVAAGILAMLPCVALTQRQVRLWRDSETLYLHAFDVTGHNALVAFFLARTLDQGHRDAEAVQWYGRVLSASPDYLPAQIRLGRVLVRTGQAEEARARLERAVRQDPENALAQASLGAALAALGHIPEAIARFEEALRLDPALVEARSKLALALAQQGDLAGALEHLRRAIEVDPDDPEARQHLAFVLLLRGDYRSAWEQVRVLRRLGAAPPDSLLRLLSEKMAEP